jgi:predicted nucleic acid-binding protein
MSGASLRAALGPSGPLVVDTSVVLSYLNGTDVFSQAAALVFDDLIATGLHTATLSAITVTETLVRPYQLGPAAVAIADTFLLRFVGVQIRDLDAALAREAARVRASTGLRIPDAVIVATALIESIPTILSTDNQWRTAVASLGGLTLVHLADHLPL